MGSHHLNIIWNFSIGFWFNFDFDQLTSPSLMSNFHPLHFSSSYTTAHRLLGTSTHLLRVKMPAWMLLTLNRRRMEMMLFMMVIVDCHWFNGMCQNDIKKTKLANQEYVTCITLLSFLLLTKNVSKMPLEILRLFNFFLCETMNINK